MNKYPSLFRCSLRPISVIQCYSKQISWGSIHSGWTATVRWGFRFFLFLSSPNHNRCRFHSRNISDRHRMQSQVRHRTSIQPTALLYDKRKKILWYTNFGPRVHQSNILFSPILLFCNFAVWWRNYEFINKYS